MPLETGDFVKVEAEEYSIRFDEAAAKVTFHGAMRLRGPREYDDMKGLLRHALGFGFPRLELDFSGLKFLNSSGLGTIGQFIVDARRAGTSRLLLRGSHAHSWQARSLGTLHRIWSDVELKIDDARARSEAPREAAPPQRPRAALEPRADSIFGHLAMRQTSFEDHPFFVHLREHPPADWVAAFLPAIAFWVKAFQDLLSIIEDRVRDPEMRAIASHIRLGDAGHDQWFVQDMALVGNPLPTYQEVFGPAHRSTRLASYALVAEVFRVHDDRLLIVLLLALEAASYVFFTKMAEYLEHAGFPHELQYFGRRHLDAELEHGIVEAEMDNQVERSFATSPELRAEALALVDRTFDAFTGMFAGFVPRR
ncbi:MAG: iron-containing redox enzyme family protein [Myxococcales bacterium]|nr:iron-containing redox enzyme family protein [Myxococcales bacterium]